MSFMTLKDGTFSSPGSCSSIAGNLKPWTFEIGGGKFTLDPEDLMVDT